MSGNVISRCLTLAFQQTHPEWEVRDRWRDGTAQALLRRDANHSLLARQTLAAYGVRPATEAPATTTRRDTTRRRAVAANL